MGDVNVGTSAVGTSATEGLPLEAWGARLQELGRDLLPTGGTREALQGRWLGHPLHPLLTDLPIGFFTSAAVLDLLAGRHARRSAQRLVGLGLLCVPPTALSGLAELADAPPQTRRTGVLHAAVNVAGTLAYVASWRARRRGHHLRGMVLGLAGGTILSVGGHLGGQLAYEDGVGVGRWRTRSAASGVGAGSTAAGAGSVPAAGDRDATVRDMAPERPLVELPS